MDNTKFLKSLLAIVEKQQQALKKMAQSGMVGDPLDGNIERLDGSISDYLNDKPKLDRSDPWADNSVVPPQSLAPNKSEHLNNTQMSEKIKLELKSPSVANVMVDQANSVVSVKFNPNTPPATKDQVFKSLQQVAGRHVGNATVKEVA